MAFLATLSGRWMRGGPQAGIDTPGVNAKPSVFEAVKLSTGARVWVSWSNKSNAGFRQLLNQVLAGYTEEETRVVVLDNFGIDKAKAVREWQRRHRREFRVYLVPTYSPRLNSIERVWRYFRRKVTDNYFLKTMARLMYAVEAFLVELAQAPALVMRLE